MTLTNLMDPVYVAKRYELEPITIIQPEYNGQAFVAVGTRVDAEVAKFYAAGKSPQAAIVNLAAIICKFTDSPDLEESIYEHYAALPKYANTPEGQIWEFADSLGVKFRAGEAITEYMMEQIDQDLCKARTEYADSEVVVRVSESMRESYLRCYDIWVFEPTELTSSDWCAVCDTAVPMGVDVCESCKERMSKY